MPTVGFEPSISAGERPQTYALDRAATGTGAVKLYISLHVHLLLISCIQFHVASVQNQILRKLSAPHEMLSGPAIGKCLDSTSSHTTIRSFNTFPN